MTEKTERPDIELARAWCGIILDNPASRDHFVSDNAAMAYFEKLRALKTICNYALNLESSKAESELARKSDRAWVESMVRAAYEDAAKIAEARMLMYRSAAENCTTGTAMKRALEAECDRITTTIRARITPPVDEGSGCVFCDLDLGVMRTTTTTPSGSVVSYAHATKHGEVPCTNRARANGDK